MPRTLYEYVGGPLCGARPDVDEAPVLLHPGGAYGSMLARTITGADGIDRTVLRWTPATGGRRNRPSCPEPCSPGCPAAPAAP